MATKRRKDDNPPKKERLAEALIAVYTTNAREKDAMRHLMTTCVSVFRFGGGLGFQEADELLDMLYGKEENGDG